MQRLSLLLHFFLLFFLIESAVAAGPLEMAIHAAMEIFTEGSFDARSGVGAGVGSRVGGGCRRRGVMVACCLG